MYDLRSNLSYLYDFYIVAKEGNFSKAANKYFLSQPSLSRNIKTLEENLNLILLNRTNKGISLTNDGEKLYKQLDELFTNLSKIDLKEEITDENLNGKLTIGITRNIADNFFSKYLLEFNRKYPKVKIKFLIDNPVSLNEYLLTHKIDFLVDYLPHVGFNEKLDLSISPIGAFKTCFACSLNTYEKVVNKIGKLEDLKEYDLVIPGSSRRRQFLEEVLQKLDIELNPMIEMPDSELMIKFVENSGTIGYFIEDEIENTNLVKLDLEDMPTNSIGLIYPKYVISNVARRFVDLILNYNENKKD